MIIMETYTYQQTINAPIKKVWDILWNDETYPRWTASFTPGSRLESDWKINGKTRFLDANGDGMVSTIHTLNPPFEVMFKHLGVVKKGIEDIDSDNVKAWTGSLEQYFLKEENGRTLLDAVIHIDPQYKEMMDNGFIKGFDQVKQLAEK